MLHFKIDTSDLSISAASVNKYTFISLVFFLYLLFNLGCADEKTGYDIGIEAFKRGHYQVAMSDFEKRAEQRDPIAEFCLGYMYNNAKGVDEDRNIARGWYNDAIRQNYTPALNNLGVMQVRLSELIARGQQPELAKTQIAKAVKLFKEAAEQGNPTAQYNLGILAINGYVEENEVKTPADWIKLAATQGYVPAQDKLAQLYQNGLWGVEKHIGKAVEWYTKAASTDWRGNRYAEAQYNLGVLHYYGIGVTQDFQAAMDLFWEASSQSLPSASYYHGLMYHNGEGFAKNIEKAIEWYTRASKQGSAHAQYALAKMYDKGEEVPKNSEKAVRYSFEAAQQGYSVAQHYIGHIFENGLNNVPQDNVEAYYWYSLAVKNSNKLMDSTENIRTEAELSHDRVKHRLNENQINEIDALVQEWKPKTLISYGTGFYINRKHILTNRHIVRSKFNEVRTPFRQVKISTIANEHESDLALLTDPIGNEKAATFRSDSIYIGEEIVLFGYPRSQILSYQGNGTLGNISGISGVITDARPDNKFQHTAPMQKGNSGSPIFDLAGNVAGISVTQLVDYRYLEAGNTLTINPPQNVNFAIKTNVIEAFLRKNGITDYTLSKGSKKIIGSQEIFKLARKLTIPVLCYKNQDEKPLPVKQVSIKELSP